MSLSYSFSKNQIEVGLDEAGRGCLAGPVFAAAVILKPDIEIAGLNDSKKLSEKERYRLEEEIKDCAEYFAIEMCDNYEIDELNILKASIRAMHKCLDTLNSKVELILVDGNQFHNYCDIPFKTIIKGDSKFASIAAASILAKCARDRFMESIHNEFEVYNWKKNKGYPTIEHRKAIREFGTCSYHRKSFKLLPDSQLDIF
ncbi:ribonuclease HII [Hyphobacterium sp. CCMP332]|nr:ribonuclease HII [Hyphobacterium sp. CCMP332]